MVNPRRTDTRASSATAKQASRENPGGTSEAIETEGRVPRLRKSSRTTNQIPASILEGHLHPTSGSLETPDAAQVARANRLQKRRDEAMQSNTLPRLTESEAHANEAEEEAPDGVANRPNSAITEGSRPDLNNLINEDQNNNTETVSSLPRNNVTATSSLLPLLQPPVTNMPVYRPALAMGVSPATLLSSPIGVVAQPAETFLPARNLAASAAPTATNVCAPLFNTGQESAFLGQNIRPASSLVQSSNVFSGDIISQWEARFNALSQQMERVVAASASANTGMVSLSAESASAQQLRCSQLRQSLFGPQPFMQVQTLVMPEIAANTLQRIWPDINVEEAHRYLKVLTIFDPLNSDVSIKDYWAWFSTVKAALTQHSNYAATYLLTRIVPPTFAEHVICSYERDLPSMSLVTVARLYGQIIYCQLKINPVEYAENLRLGRDRLMSQEDLYRRVVDLHFSRCDRPEPITFCYELAIGIGHHQTEAQQAVFSHSILSRYPGLQQAANRLKGLAIPVKLDQQQGLINQQLPVNARDCEQFAEWVLTLADVQPMIFKPEKRNAPVQKDNIRNNKVPPFKKAKTQVSSTHQVAANIVPQTAISAATFPLSNERPAVNEKVETSAKRELLVANDDDLCRIHKNQDHPHKNRDCRVQHPELRKSKAVRNPVNVPHDFPPENYCPIHTRLRHKWRKCRFHPDNKGDEAPSITPVLVSQTAATSSSNEVVLECNQDSIVAKVACNSSSFVCNIRRTPQEEVKERAQEGQLSESAIRVEEIVVDAENIASDSCSRNSPENMYIIIPFFSREPLLKLFLLNTLYTALGDTGSGITLISATECSLFPQQLRMTLKNAMVCLPFNSNENNINPDERFTKLTEVIIIPVKLLHFQFLFPFFIFPGDLDRPILGRDFLRHTSLSVHCTENCFKVVATHKLPLYDSSLLSSSSTSQLIKAAQSVSKVLMIEDDLHPMNQWKLPAGCIKCVLLESYYFLPDCSTDIFIQPEDKPLRPYVSYQAGIIPLKQRHEWFTLQTTQIYINSPSPPDILRVFVVASTISELKEGELFIWLAPLQQVAINQSAVTTTTKRDYPTMSTFTPKPFLPYYPLPTSSDDLPMEDYSEDEYKMAATEVDTYVVKKDMKTFLQPRPGLLIEAGESDFSEVQLVLTAKALEALPVGVWHQERPDILPGIPEHDVVIPVPLTTTKPIYIKPRRLNPSIYSEVACELNRQIKLGLIEPVRSPYASPIVAVPKPKKKIRICTDYREFNKIAVADHYPLPRIEDVLAMAAGCQYLSLLDLVMGFNQLHIHPADRHKLAFITPMGHFQWNRLPFGYLNGPAAFQREFDTTLGSLTMQSRPYIDDLISGDKDTHKRHDAKLQTILYNCFRRGLAVHAEKSKLLGSSVVLLGMNVSANGIRPHIKHGIFPKLKARHHTSLKHLRQTVGVLLWYRRFIPSFSFIIKPLLDAMKELTSTSTDNLHLDEICRPVIDKVEAMLNDKTVLAHPHPTSPKIIQIVAGRCAFAATLYQQPLKGKREVIEHLSKVWPLDTRSYSAEERYALAVRETVERLRAIIQHSVAITIVTPSITFTTLAKKEDFWNARITRLLFVSTTLPIEFRTEPCDELPILNDDFSEPIAYGQKGFIRQEIASFFNISLSDVDNLQKVYTDGSCIKIGMHRLAGLGVFWEENSKYNLSQCCSIPPFTNNRAELEAILAALTQANQLNIRTLLLYSDSKNSIQQLNSLHAEQRKGTPIEDMPSFTGSQVAMANQDLFQRILKQLQSLQVFFLFVPRILNGPADALSRAYWASRRNLLPQNELAFSDCSETPTDECFSSESDSENSSAMYKKIQSILRLSAWDNRDPFKSLTESVSSSSNFQKIFMIDHSGFSPEQEVINIINENHCNLPKVPLLDTGHYLQLISQLPMLQKADPEIAALIEALKTQQPLGLSQIMGNYYPTAFIAPDTSLVWVRHQYVDKILVPPAAQFPIVELLHSSPQFGAHCGITPTTKLVQRLFIWKGMKNMITNYCKNCQVCKLTKSSNSKTAGRLAPLPLVSKTCHRWHIDSIEGLPMSSPPGRYTYILVLVDAFTKFVLAFPLASLKAPNIVRSLNGAFTLFGPPKIIVSDNGPEFKNKIVFEFLSSWGIEHRPTTPHNPQANGQAEALVKIITMRLKSFLQHLAFTKSDLKYTTGCWAAILPQIVYSYNVTYQSKLGASPYEMVFGRLPPALTKDVVAESKLWGDISTNYCNNLKEALAAIHAQAEFQLFRHQKLMAKQYNKHRIGFIIKEGDFVYLGPAYSAILSKLTPNFEGPYKVVKVQKHLGIHEVTGVCLDIGSLEKPLLRWYPRYRVRPVGNLNPSIQWFLK